MAILTSATKSKLRATLFRVVQLSWGAPQNMLGAAGYFALSNCAKEKFRECYVTRWQYKRGLSLGLFLFVPQRASEAYLLHEYGHSIQSLILGPAYLPLVALPSLLWAGMPAAEKLRKKKHLSYYAFAPEKTANFLARIITGKQPITV